MFLTSGYILIEWILVKSGYLHTFRRDFQKNWKFSSLGWHVVRDFRQDVLRQHLLWNASLLHADKLLMWVLKFFPISQRRKVPNLPSLSHIHSAKRCKNLNFHVLPACILFPPPPPPPPPLTPTQSSRYSTRPLTSRLSGRPEARRLASSFSMMLLTIDCSESRPSSSPTDGSLDFWPEEEKREREREREKGLVVGKLSRWGGNSNRIMAVGRGGGGIINDRKLFAQSNFLSSTSHLSSGKIFSREHREARELQTLTSLRIGHCKRIMTRRGNPSHRTWLFDHLHLVGRLCDDALSWKNEKRTRSRLSDRKRDCFPWFSFLCTNNSNLWQWLRRFPRAS